MTPIDILFYIFSATALLFALRVVMSKNPISSAFSLIVVFFCVAADYALMHAHFLAAIQILVYAGAIMVLFIFVIMLLNADIRNLDFGKSKAFQGGAAALCAALLAMFIWCLNNGSYFSVKSGFTPDKIDSLGGNVQVVSTVLFSDYVLPFELTSILLLVGIVGSVALAKRKLGEGDKQ
jgi:NADH-quinone oxidoreductase subunit J